MFYKLHTSQWSLKMICENFEDWIYQSCIERDKEEREEAEEIMEENTTLEEKEEKLTS